MGPRDRLGQRPARLTGDPRGSRLRRGRGNARLPALAEGDESTSAFVEDFKSASPRRVQLAPFAAQEFDATILCYLAAVAAGSTDGQKMADELIDITAPGGTEYSWQQLPEAVKALEDGKDIDYTGASGRSTWTSMAIRRTGSSTSISTPRAVSGGRRDPVEKPNPATF